MFNRKQLSLLGALAWLPLYFLVQWISHYPVIIEKYYSQGFYPIWSQLLRALWGPIPFSVGDIGYSALILFGVIKIYTHIKSSMPFENSLLFLGKSVSVLYITFNLSWGLNYYRLPLQETLKLTLIAKDSSALNNLTTALVRKANSLHLSLETDPLRALTVPYSETDILKKASQGFKEVAKNYPNLYYSKPAIKKSLFALPLSYMGYAGYLNPFSLEAQINQKIPTYRLAVVATHEIGHQLGYASERDTNFIGYLAALEHSDSYFKYAATTLALSYCLGDLKRENTTAYKVAIEMLRPGILENFRSSNRFWQAYKNPLSPYFESVFNKFLIINHQPQGVKSYGQMVQLLLAYHSEFPLEKN
jgi:hypothetical protein